MDRKTLKKIISEALKKNSAAKAGAKTLVASPKSKLRESVKASIRKLVLNELTQANFGVGQVYTPDKLEKSVKKDIGSAGEALTNPLNNSVVVNDGDEGKNIQFRVWENGKGLFDVTAYVNGSDYARGRQLSAEKLSEFLKEISKKDKISYVDKAFKKGKAPITNKEEDNKTVVSFAVDVTDETVETDGDTQIDIADDATRKAEEKVIKDLVPVDGDMAAPLGGELVDKIERIIDRVLKTKVEPSTAYLKADPDVESPDKLVAKNKDTPKLKDSEKAIGPATPKKPKPDEKAPKNPTTPDKPIPKNSVVKKKVNEETTRDDGIPVFLVLVPANVYDGKYYDHRTYRMVVPISDEVKTEQDAIKWVNDHKKEVLDKADKSRVGTDRRRRIKFPVDKNVFFKPTYQVRKSTVWPRL